MGRSDSMVGPNHFNTSLLFKISDINSTSDFIHMNNHIYSFITTTNISSCLITMIEPIHDILTTIDIIPTSSDFVISNISWNKYYHPNFIWIQSIINHRLSNVMKFKHLYSQPIFICDLYYNDTFIQIFTINTYPSTGKIFHSLPFDPFIIHDPYLSIKPNQISIILNNLIISIDYFHQIDSVITEYFGFIPPILFKFIYLNKIIIGFKPFTSSMLADSHQMISAFYR